MLDSNGYHPGWTEAKPVSHPAPSTQQESVGCQHISWSNGSAQAGPAYPRANDLPNPGNHQKTLNEGPRSIQSDTPRPGPGEYGSRQIARKLGALDAHSFYRKLRSIEKGTPPEATEKIAAIVYHRDANIPIPASPQSFEIWTRHDFSSINAHFNVALPFFHYSDSEASRTLWTRFHTSFYCFLGYYSIQSAEVIQGGSPEVRAFIEQREESKRKRPADKWKAMLEEDWMKVTVVKCSEDVQREKPNPMEAGGTEMERSVSSSSEGNSGQPKHGW